MFPKWLFPALVVAGALFGSAPATPAGSPDLWIHILVHETNEDGDQVEVNLPLDMAEAVEVVRDVRQGDHLLINVHDEDAIVRVQVPVKVVDALLSGEGHELDLVAAIRALRSHGESDLVSIEDGDSPVHIWVDEMKEPAGKKQGAL